MHLPRRWRRALVGQGMVGVERLRLQHLVDVLELRVAWLWRWWIGHSALRLAVEQLCTGVLRVERRVGMRRVWIRRRWVRALRHGDGCSRSRLEIRRSTAKVNASGEALAREVRTDGTAIGKQGQEEASLVKCLARSAPRVPATLLKVRVVKRKFCKHHRAAQLDAFGKSRPRETLHCINADPSNSPTWRTLAEDT